MSNVGRKKGNLFQHKICCFTNVGLDKSAISKRGAAEKIWTITVLFYVGSFFFSFSPFLQWVLSVNPVCKIEQKLNEVHCVFTWGLKYRAARLHGVWLRRVKIPVHTAELNRCLHEPIIDLQSPRGMREDEGLKRLKGSGWWSAQKIHGSETEFNRCIYTLYIKLESFLVGRKELKPADWDLCVGV